MGRGFRSSGSPPYQSRFPTKHEKPRAGAGPGVALACGTEAAGDLPGLLVHNHSTATLLKRCDQGSSGRPAGRDPTGPDLPQMGAVSRRRTERPVVGLEGPLLGTVEFGTIKCRLSTKRWRDGADRIVVHAQQSTSPPHSTCALRRYLVHHLAEKRRGVSVIVLFVGAGAFVAVRPLAQVIGLQATNVGIVVPTLLTGLVGRLVPRRL